jgi:hypothetical protein
MGCRRTPGARILLQRSWHPRAGSIPLTRRLLGRQTCPRFASPCGRGTRAPFPHWCTCSSPRTNKISIPPYLTKKDVLHYPVIIHVQSTVDFDPENPTPSSSPPDSDDCDSGHDGNQERHHFSRPSGRRVQGFRCTRGVIDGQPNAGGGPDGHGQLLRRVSASTTPTHSVECPEHDIGAMADADGGPGPTPETATTTTSTPMDMMQFDLGGLHNGGTQQWDAHRSSAGLGRNGETLTGAQLASDPMVLEAGLLCDRILIA